MLIVGAMLDGIMIAVALTLVIKLAEYNWPTPTWRESHRRCKRKSREDGIGGA